MLLVPCRVFCASHPIRANDCQPRQEMKGARPRLGPAGDLTVNVYRSRGPAGCGKTSSADPASRFRTACSGVLFFRQVEVEPMQFLDLPGSICLAAVVVDHVIRDRQPLLPARLRGNHPPRLFLALGVTVKEPL